MLHLLHITEFIITSWVFYYNDTSGSQTKNKEFTSNLVFVRNLNKQNSQDWPQEIYRIVVFQWVIRMPHKSSFSNNSKIIYFSVRSIILRYQQKLNFFDRATETISFIYYCLMHTFRGPPRKLVIFYMFQWFIGFIGSFICASYLNSATCNVFLIYVALPTDTCSVLERWDDDTDNKMVF